MGGVPFPVDMLARRVFLRGMAGSLGSMAVSHLLRQQGTARGDEPVGNASPTPGASFGRAKSVICLFQHGGPSQMDLFDPKPLLTRYDGQPYPGGDLEAHFDQQKGNCLGSPYKFAKYGGCGMDLCELLPHTGAIADEICLVRSMKTESVDHEAALRLIHTGKFLAGMPVWGSWVLYALGSENENLPAYVVLSDPGGLPVDGERNWSSGWLPAQFQGTTFRSGANPVLNLTTPSGISGAARRRQLDFLKQINTGHLNRHPHSSELAARLTQFETAARMQTAVPEVLDLSSETESTRKLYGLDEPATQEYGTRCLLARRLVERGVRFVQLYLSGQPWDTHSKNAESLKGLCRRTDQSSAALVRDLKQRGLLDSTIVIWTGEFGRLPISQGKDGRDHNRHGFSLWLAGGGFRRGHVHGATDEFGYAATQDIVNVHDLHATLLHALGLDHRRLTLPHDGREASLTDVDVTGAQRVDALLG
ncbi:MAG: DUF1501 domain-containing protein [Planctomycetes bacterium]|nr:DUF1501 domain-containing protein [Planctomycetota bacterium]